MKIKLILPACWNELTEKQFQKIVMLISTTEPSLKQHLKVFKILCNYKWWQFKKHSKIRVILSQVPMSELFNSFDYIYKENNRTVFIPEIKVGSKTYFAPMDRIINLSATEFAVADDLHIGYRKTKDVEYLQNLFHTIYTEAPERPLFNKLNLPKLINKKVPLSILLATELTYFGCKNHIAKRYHKAFPVGSGPSSGNKNGFGKVIQQMAKGDLSKLPIIENINIYKFLDQFQDDIEMIQQAKMKK
jgi:hypothetical protein